MFSSTCNLIGLGSGGRFYWFNYGPVVASSLIPLHEQIYHRRLTFEVPNQSANLSHFLPIILYQTFMEIGSFWNVNGHITMMLLPGIEFCHASHLSNLIHRLSLSTKKWKI